MMTEIKVSSVVYWSPEGQCHGTNVTYLLDGQPASARLPWVASVQEAERFIRSQREKCRG